jgi:hypothetical protein
MLARALAPLAVLLSTSAPTVSAASSPASPRHAYQVAVEHPSLSALSFVNRSAAPVVLRPISFSGRRVLHALSDLDQGVGATPPEHPDYSVATQVFRFVANEFFHAYPLSVDYTWSLSPTLFLNSSGKSLCGDAANLVVELATRRGLLARRWALRGHVVAEVFDGGKWKMYDADFGVFFLNRAGEIASVAELESDSDLILDPILRMPTRERWDPYTAGYAQLFATRDNVVAWNDPTGPPAEPLDIQVPQYGRVSFFGRYAHAPPAVDGNPIAGFENLKLVVPPGFSGEVDVFLILHAVRGRGEIALDGVRFAIGSPELEAAIAANRGPEVVLEVTEAISPVELIYLLNPQRFQLLPNTVLVVDGAIGALETVALGDPASDSDGDGVRDDGDADGIAAGVPCRLHQTEGCDDNCTFVSNPAQVDADDDRAGNACDGDVDQNGFVDELDRRIVEECAIAGWGAVGPPGDPSCLESDLTEDGAVDAGDLARLSDLELEPPRPGELRVATSDPLPSLCGSGFEVAFVPLIAVSLGLRRRRR